MKRSVLRIGCAVLSLSAAAGLLASCSLLPPASPLPDSKPAQAEEAPGPAAASLDDGKLRILYSNGSNGGNTVLCGNTVLYQAASSETVYLVPDTLTGTVRYYLRQWSAPGTPTGRATALCDRSGKEILTFDRAYDAVLTGSLLVLTAPEQMAYAPCNNHAAGDCRVIDLATGEELAAAMREAMREAGLTPREIGFVNAHGTATLYNDEMESRALHRAGLGNKPLNSLKPYLGHTLGASGIVETILTAEQLRRGLVFGTPGYAECGTPLPVNVAPHHREMPLTAALKSASGFGGCNAAVVLSRGPFAERPPQEPRGVRTVASYALSDRDGEFTACIRREYASAGRTDMRFSRMDNLSKLGYIAAEKLLAVGKYGAWRVGIVMANRSASLDTDIRHQQIVESHPEEGASPAVFVHTLPNIAAGELSIRHGIKGEGLFFIEPSFDEDGFVMRGSSSPQDGSTPCCAAGANCSASGMKCT